jgi:hypothetical protein
MSWGTDTARAWQVKQKQNVIPAKAGHRKLVMRGLDPRIHLE